MTPEEIVVADHKKNNSEYPLETVLTAFWLTMNDPNVQITQAGDTLLILDRESKSFHFVNAARFPEFVENVTTLLGDPAIPEGWEIHTTFTNPKIVEVAKLTPYDYTVSQTGDHYTMTVRL